MMVEKIGTIKNPLTIIAIFAGLAEIGGTIVLPLLEPEIQIIYVWFLIFFPALLVVFFFCTLNFNHIVLYAPSDYKYESNFIKYFERATPEDILNKNKNEIEEITEEEELELKEKYTTNKNTPDQKTIKNNIRGTYQLAEDLALAKIQKEFNAPIRREAVLKNHFGRLVLDGYIKTRNSIHIIEVKYARSNIKKSLQLGLGTLTHALEGLDRDSKRKIKLILAIVTDKEISYSLPSEEYIRIEDKSIRVDIRHYRLTDLENEFCV